MPDMMPDDLWRDFPKTAPAFEARFKTEEDCRAYWIEADDPAPLQAARMMPTQLPGMMTRRELVDYYLERAGRDRVLRHHPDSGRGRCRVVPDRSADVPAATVVGSDP